MPRLIALNDVDFPKRLKIALQEMPTHVAHVAGNLDILNRPTIAIVGSRDITDGDRAIIRDIVSLLAPHGVAVVSGHARGADICAHQAALQCGLGTVVVLSEGINKATPRPEIQNLTTQENTLVISEFPLDAEWSIAHAMQRNKTIINLSDVVILIKAGMSGGAFNAGEYAMKVCTPLFVVAYGEYNEKKAGNMHFINRGAFPLYLDVGTRRTDISLVVEMLGL